MRKTFAQLTYGDPIYIAERNSSVYRTGCAGEVTRDYVRVNNSFIAQRNSLTVVSYDNSFYFCNEEDAIRYCKAQAIKTLFSLIDDVKGRFKVIKNFKMDNWEQLNTDFITKEINKLQTQINKL